MTQPPIKSAVIGWPVAHSLSPVLHGYWLKELGIDGTYEAIAVREEELGGFMTGLAAAGFAGLNVTVPHKRAVMAHLDSLTALARRIGAVNTVVVDETGRLHGDNTDAYGFLENLKQGHPGFHAGRGPAVVLGAGGAARAVAVALLDDGAPSVILVNRTRERAEELARDLGGGVSVADWRDRGQALEGAALLVNTTTLGMTGKPPLELSLEALPVDALVNDIVYAPLQTPLLEAAAARGNPVVDGLGMLLHQARPGFAAWFGVEPVVSDGLRRHVLAAREA